MVSPNKEGKRGGITPCICKSVHHLLSVSRGVYRIRLSRFFYGKKPALLGLFSPPEVFCGPQICQTCVGGPSRLGRAPQSPPLWAPLTPRFSHLWRSASVAPQCKILATPLSVLGTKCCLSILSLAEVLTMKKRVDVQLFIRIAAAAD